MFRVYADKNRKVYQLAVIGLLLFSAAAVVITLWILSDLLREEEVVKGLLVELQDDALESARSLVSELEWQFRLTILVVLNVMVMGIAIAFLWRAYRASQDTLRDVKALASDILNSLDQAVITTDKQGIVTSINRHGLKMLAPATECVGRPLIALSGHSDCSADIGNVDKVADSADSSDSDRGPISSRDSSGPTIPLGDFYQAWIAANSAITRQYRIVGNSHERIWQMYGRALRNENAQQIGFVLQISDITEQTLMEDQLHRMERFMELNLIAAGLHHEIKNPLTALSLHIQLLDENLSERSPSQDVCQMLRVIRTEIFRVGDVLENFRDFASNTPLNFQMVNLADLIQHQIELISPQADQQLVQIRSEFSKETKAEILADGGRLEQVLLNLLLNALQAMPNGGYLTVSYWTELEASIIEVSDTGNGISADVQDKIFEPYFTTKKTGTGLGLALCEKIIEQHGGRLTFQTSPNGTTFRVTLPKSPEGKYAEIE